MQRIFSIISNFKEYFILLVLIALSFLLLASNDNIQIRKIRAFTIGIIGYVQNTAAIIPNIFELKRENEILRRLNVDLLDEVSRLREAKLENIRLRKLLEFKETARYSLIPADVIGKTLHLHKNTITLNAGKNDGIDVNMPIISELGAVGVIIEVSENFSVGRLLYNRDFRTSVKIQRSRVDGILTWDGSEFLIMKNVSKKQDVKLGDLVVTSEYSNIFPPGIKIGIVVFTEELPSSLFKKILIKPSVNFFKLEEVFVINKKPDPQRVELEKKIQKKN